MKELNCGVLISLSLRMDCATSSLILNWFMIRWLSILPMFDSFAMQFHLPLWWMIFNSWQMLVHFHWLAKKPLNRSTSYSMTRDWEISKMDLPFSQKSYWNRYLIVLQYESLFYPSYVAAFRLGSSPLSHWVWTSFPYIFSNCGSWTDNKALEDLSFS
jgi:hypothetical protein